ncbi:MAG: Gfo/Idh/MocA family oxidoreductase [Candidatus Latescibacteria bacterium]|nr:Gfo/Idh/MocA family oxidoreductase [Candidatus Latescibacterota bacterium]
MSTQQTVRLGIVGCGSRGISVGGLFKRHPHCEITALFDRFDRVAERAAHRLDLSDARIYRDVEGMLRDAPVDAIFFACDPTVQVDLACEAMMAGRHVCTEVPAAFTVEECWRLVTTVEKTGRTYQLMEQTRYWGFIEVWKQMHDRGEFGHICLAQGEYIHYSHQWDLWTDLETGERLTDVKKPVDRNVEERWRRKVLADPIYYLPHTLSPILRVLDDRVVRVSCMGTRPQSYTDPELPWRDTEYALMHTEKDTLLLVGTGFSLPHVPRGQTSCHWYEFRGTRASVESPRCPSDSFRVWRDGMETFDTMDLSLIPVDADALQVQSGHGGADYKPVDTFIRAILDETTPPMDVYLSVETAAPAIVAAESARQNGVSLEVPDFRRDRV